VVPEGWSDLPFFAEAWPGIAARLAGETREVLPPDEQRFRALEALAPDAVRAVILGQDPYPTPGHANGLAFSVAPGTPLPRSLKNIFRELEDDLGVARADGDLSDWVENGVLLLNTALTTPAGEAGGHARLGWSRLVEEVLARLSDRPRAFVLWGNHAQGFRPHIAGADHLIHVSAHPSPLSASRGFFGSKPFSRVNDWLAARGEAPIRWT
jgi:uracil-DNA glycosylase